MAASRVLFALVVLLRGLPASAAGQIFPDQDDNCNVMQQCSAQALVDAERGLCVEVKVGTTLKKQCWDACNTAHKPLDYAPATDPFQKGIALMVKQFRTGQRGQNSCPDTKTTPVCNPGERCTPPGLTWGRGMCTLKAGEGNVCLDMCNAAIALTAFKAAGKEAGTITTVQMVRAGRDPDGLTTCPGPSVWYWLWFPILLCCCVGICALAYYMYSYYRRRLKKTKDTSGFMDEDMMPMQDMPYQDYNEVAPQPMQEPLPIAGEPVPSTQDFIREPELPPLQPVADPVYEQNIFGQPNLLRNPSAQPQTVAMPMGTNLGGFPTIPSARVGSSFQPMATGFGGSMGTQMPAYGAYGAYGGGGTQMGAGFPTGSMRIA